MPPQTLLLQDLVGKYLQCLLIASVYTHCVQLFAAQERRRGAARNISICTGGFGSWLCWCQASFVVELISVLALSVVVEILVNFDGRLVHRFITNHLEQHPEIGDRKRCSGHRLILMLHARYG
ncbi:uncharacterized protein LOC106170762 isoform X2 [Lingula anatina]|uniref:Uncharacterized protein LOC106170762 isoform X2 n=1 Tax=Lingula anatina TaxID=7574 RepID=A0A1S3J730_LINAN|nr:uncharacterized protein LOC106170762 isoform X2 [Lingula anatina]|eukprot:XP_013406205.1 uncharacterized protein LOC106170762 isoform X2 [Lingula anatina]